MDYYTILTSIDCIIFDLKKSNSIESLQESINLSTSIYKNIQLKSFKVNISFLKDYKELTKMMKVLNFSYIDYEKVGKIMEYLTAEKQKDFFNMHFFSNNLKAQCKKISI